eukprot:gene46763-58310_t
MVEPQLTIAEQLADLNARFADCLRQPGGKWLPSVNGGRPRWIRSATVRSQGVGNILELPAIAVLMCRLVEANLGFTQQIVTDVLVTEDCWNATSFIHALRAREKNQKVNILESMRTSLDAAMDMVIVDLAKTLIQVYGFHRDDVLDAIATFRCHTAED